MKCEQGPRAGPHDPKPGPLAGRFLYITIKSWALSGNPQRYTEPPLPSAEQCTIPFLLNVGGATPNLSIEHC